MSDQQRRRELSLRRQEQSRRDAQLHARRLASTLFSLDQSSAELSPESEVEFQSEPEPETENASSAKEIDIREASKLRGAEARKWFARQLMLPEWMIDVPDRLPHDWSVYTYTHIDTVFVFNLISVKDWNLDCVSGMCLRGLPGSDASSWPPVERRSVGRETALFFTISRRLFRTELEPETPQAPLNRIRYWIVYSTR